MKVSIIVPVYNTKQYLHSCIESILNQSFSDFEVLLIDDGSTDGSEDICDKYSIEDQRVKVIHQINHGLSYTRNIGIKTAVGEYVCFVDSDDIVHKQMLEILTHILDNTHFEFVHCGFQRFYEDNPSFEELKEDVVQKVLHVKSSEGMVKMMDWKHYGHYVFKGLYRLKYIRNKLFIEGRKWEDIPWSAEVVGGVEEYGYLPVELYGYRMRNESIVHNMTIKNQMDYFISISDYALYNRQHFPQNADDIDFEVYYGIVSKYCNIIRNESVSKTETQKVIEYSKKCHMSFSRVLKNKMNIKRKLIFLTSLISFPLACNIRNMLLK